MTDLQDARRLLELTLPEYSTLRTQYHQDIYDAVANYLGGQGNIAGFGNDMRIAVTEAFTEAAHLGWNDGVSVSSGKYAAKGGLLEDEEASALLSAMIGEENGHVTTLAVRFRSIRTGEFLPEIAASEAQSRADGYTKTLDRVYANFKVLAAGGVMLTFDGDDGLESCADCIRYKGQRHRAWWWVRRNAVPPNREFECGGYQCFHLLMDDQGNLFTI